MANGGARWSLDFHLLKTTGAAAAATMKWAEEPEHLAVPRVR